MRPESLANERFDGLKGDVEIDGKQNIPKTDNSTEIRVMSEISLREKLFQFGGTGESSR